MQYLAYKLCASTPNIVVDGTATASTELVLSHWVNSGTPEHLKDDLSAQIVFKYLAQSHFRVSAQAVTNNHFDADGLVGIYSLLHPEDADGFSDLLIDVAGCGDFNKYRNRDAARISFVLDAWQNPKLSPLKASIFAEDYLDLSNILYEELLPRLANIIEKIDFMEKYWIQQDTLLETSEDAFTEGTFKLEELPDLDLAIITMPDSNRSPRDSIHKMAIHNQTDCMRILIMQETNFELYYRYETWVEYRSFVTKPRIELAPLAEMLTKQESMDGVWSFSDINGLSPAMRLTGDFQSRIPFESFRSQTLAFLTQNHRQP